MPQHSKFGDKFKVAIEKLKKADTWIDSKLDKVQKIGKDGYAITTDSKVEKKSIYMIIGGLGLLLILAYFLFKKKR